MLSLLLLIAAAIVVVITSPSCGTDFGKDAEPSAVLVGEGNLPGVIGTIGTLGSSATFLPSDLPTPETDPNVGSGAPLGHSAEYDTQHGSADEELVHSTSRTTSALAPGEVFKLLWVAMVPEGVTPVANGPRYAFKEGDSVDLYADYEVAANTPYVRRWTIDSADLDYTEDYRTHTVAGEYRVKLNYVLPIGSRAVNATFSFEAYSGMTRTAASVGNKTTSVGVVLPGPGLQILDITMMHDGEPVDWTLTHNQFFEGEDVDLYMKYEVLSNQLNIDRHWDSEDIELAQWDYAVPHTKGMYEVKLDYVIPGGTAKDNCIYQYDLTALGETEYSEPFLFDVLAPGTIANFNPSEIINFPQSDSVWCGRMSVLTSHVTYPPRAGSADGMIQNYDKRYSPVLDFFNLQTKHLLNVTQLITDPNQKFKIILANADMSQGARLSINKTYNGFDPSTYVTAQSYDDTALASLPVYSLGGVAGTTKLTQLQLSFSSNTIHDRMLVASSPGAVKKNVPGPNGEYRNGAFTLQLVAVNADGTHAFTTNPAQSKGGVQGAAKTGLLYESACWYTWGGPGNKQSPWPNYNPGADKKCYEFDPLTGPRLLCRGTTLEQIDMLAGTSKASFPNAAGGQYQMNWEDLQQYADADYNDLVARMQATEYYLPSGALKQITLTIKACARGNSDPAEWQLNLNGAFPAASAVSTVNQFFDDEDGDFSNDVTHEFDGLWSSTGGIALPVFQNTRMALPDPATKTKTANVVSGSSYILGDYSVVRIVFKGAGVLPGTYTAAPYTPELRVQPANKPVYVYNLWKKKGDPLFSNGMPKGGFIMPASFPWALEGKAMGTAYSGWSSWVTWLGQSGSAPAPATKWWEQTPTANYFKRSLFQ
jgi:hypothetical protein